MNEPACFDPYDKSMPKSNLQTLSASQTVEHRDCHNVYGYFNTQATYEGLFERTPDNERPFVLTRSFFAGSQKYAAVWAGDCKGNWEHFKLGIAILLSTSICGISFIGGDVPGFFGDPEENLVVRWYQMGILMPFFRAHASDMSKRREPWLYREEVTGLIRESIVLRYKLLPYM